MIASAFQELNATRQQIAEQKEALAQSNKVVLVGDYLEVLGRMNSFFWTDHGGKKLQPYLVETIGRAFKKGEVGFAEIIEFNNLSEQDQQGILGRDMVIGIDPNFETNTPVVLGSNFFAFQQKTKHRLPYEALVMRLQDLDKIFGFGEITRLANDLFAGDNISPQKFLNRRLEYYNQLDALPVFNGYIQFRFDAPMGPGTSQRTKEFDTVLQPAYNPN